jgi:hypothetical protein
MIGANGSWQSDDAQDSIPTRQGGSFWKNARDVPAPQLAA